MQLYDDQGLDFATLVAVIAHSQIVVPRPVELTPLPHVPDGFDEVDFAVLDWIAAEGRRAGRNLLRM
jgi:hypothetical protein